MQRLEHLTLLLSIALAAADLMSASPVAAQGYGWGLSRAPMPRRRVPRARPAPHPIVVPRIEERGWEVEVPIPMPRPHFPGDPPVRSSETAPPHEPDRPPSTELGSPEIGPEKPNLPASRPLYGPFKPLGAAKPPPLPPAKPADLGKAGVALSGARLGEAPGQPEDDATCQDRIKARGVEAEPTEIGPQPDPRCTVVRAVRLTSLTLREGGKVSFPERPTIACPLADAFSHYIRDVLSPLAKGTYGAPVASVWTGPGLECRSRDHIEGAKLSAHGQGLAVDIAQLKLSDGRMFEVGRPKGDVDQSFETAARAAGCGYFHTALGPGTDAFHATHWHFDLEVRGAHGDSKYCK